MTVEEEKPKLVVRKPADHHRRGSFIFAVPSEEDTTIVDIEKLRKEINETTKYKVRKRRGTSDRRRRNPKP